MCGGEERSRALGVIPSAKQRSVLCSSSLCTDDFVTHKKSILRIKNEDELCAARAIVSALWDKETRDEAWDRHRMGEMEEEERARALCRRAGVPLDRSCGIPELEQFQAVLKEEGVRLHVFYDHLGAICYAGKKKSLTDAVKDIYLYHHDDHYDVITSMKGFLCKSYYCQRCDQGIRIRVDMRVILPVDVATLSSRNVLIRVNRCGCGATDVIANSRRRSVSNVIGKNHRMDARSIGLSTVSEMQRMPEGDRFG